MSVNALTKADWALVLIAWIAVLLVGALVMEHGFGMEPCPLCLMQQAWFYIAGLVVLAGLIDHPARGIYPLLAILAAVVGGGFAIRHIWIGTLPPESVPACGAGVDTLIEWGMWSEALTAMTVGTGDCVESGGGHVPWSVASHLGARRIYRGRHGRHHAVARTLAVRVTLSARDGRGIGNLEPQNLSPCRESCFAPAQAHL